MTMFLNLRIVSALILREMGAVYGRAPGGYAWAVLSPLGAILVLSAAFSFIVRTPALGTSFILFYATGYLPFDVYAQLAGKIAASLRFSKPLMVYPNVGWMHAIVARAVLNILTLVTVFCIVTVGILIFVDVQTTLHIGMILLSLSMAASLGIAMGMMNCFLGGMFPIWDRLWAIVSRPLFLLSGIFFIYEDVPEFGQEILWWNPLIHVTATMRAGFYPTYYASFVSAPYVFGIALVLALFSLIFLRRYNRSILEK